jgi:uncharacterized protein
MLVSFSVSNFRSFGEEVTLNMVASNKLTAHSGHLVPISGTGKNLVRAAVLYGANAAGKSNLVRAISVAQQLIRGPRSHTAPAYPPSAVPFLLHGNKPRETSFEFRFLIENRVFVYGFDVFQGRFTSEWLALVVKPGADDVVLFQRKADGSAEIDSQSAARKLFPNDAISFQTLLKLASLQLRNDQLLLNRATELPEAAQGSTLRAIIKWLTRDLVVIPVDYRTCDIVDRLKTDATFRKFCGRFLNKVGTGVGELDVNEIDREGQDYECKFLSEYPGAPASFFGCGSDTNIRLNPTNPTRVIVRQLMAFHAAGSNRFGLPFSEESDGTQSLLHLLPAIASPTEENTVIVIDELDRSLHPLICWEFIRFFSESCPGARRQLIVTTHEAHLLNQELLRRDEYWFVEKDDFQQSRLTSLSEYDVRNDLQLRKGYLNGRFGAIPMIGGMDELEKLLECRQEEVHAEENAPT